MKSKIAMANKYAHKSTGFVIKEQSWEAVEIGRTVMHPSLGRCFIGSFCDDNTIAMFNVHYPDYAVRPVNAIEREQILKTTFEPDLRPYRISEQQLASQADLDQMPEVPHDKL